MPKGKASERNKRYPGEFKQKVVEHMRSDNMSYRETGRQYGVNHNVVMSWDRIYQEEGVTGLLEERRGRAIKTDGVKKGRKPKIEKTAEKDLIAENQRLRMEIDYLKKLNALVQERQHQERKSKQSGN